MKKIFSILLIASALMTGFTSCSDFLEEDNKAGSTADLTYSTATGLSGLVNSMYAFSRGWWGKEAGLGLSEMGSDLFYYGYDNKQKSLNSYDISSAALDDDSSDNPCLDHYWELFYCAIDVCNNTIYYVGNSEDIISDDKKNAYLGEAYFMRALYYFQMVQIWGPLPYNSEPITTVTTDPVRIPEEEVVSNILSDIDTAMDYFEAASVMKKASATSTGHGTYYAAQALKARVLLFAASWLGSTSISTNSSYSGKNLYSLALSAAEDVINNSGATFYDRYSDTWNLNNEGIDDNTEAIWGVYYDADIASTVNCIPYRYKTDSDGDYESYCSLITRTGYTRGGSAMHLMFPSMWNNGASDLGGNGKEVFVRVLGESTSYITHTQTGESVYVAPYYSPYGRGFTRYLPSLYLWQLFESVKDTDQRYDGTLQTHYNMAYGLGCGDGYDASATNYPKMGAFSKDPQDAYDEDGNYFNAGDTAIAYVFLDGDSSEGQKAQDWAYNRYRIQFAYGGDIPVYTSGDPATALPVESYPATSSVYGDDRYNSYKIGGWCSYPGIKKFLDDQYNATYPTHDICARDAIVFRLAEMYLIKAEAELAVSGSSTALATINELRSVRAIDGKDNTISGTVTIETILEERALELCGEQLRWFDLKRTHTLLDHVKAYNAQGADNIAEKHYYRPIPLTQLDAVTNLVSLSVSQSDGVLQYSSTNEGFWQNPGY